jgi:hypothetical protein
VLGYVVVFAFVPASLLGKLVGAARPERVSEKTFREATLGITLLNGVLGLDTALWGGLAG